MNPPKHAVGIDIGGTKIAVGVVATASGLRASRTIPTESRRGVRHATHCIVNVVRQALHDCAVSLQDVAGVGIGCAGPVDPARGEINNPHTLPGWEQWNIVDSLTNELGLRVWLENDADAAAFGEYQVGAGSGADTFVMLTLGTGVGGAVIAHGDIHRGTKGGHPEIGHLPILFGGRDCYCGRPGCLESIVSGTAIATEGALFGLGSAAEVFAAAAGGRIEARQILAGVEAAMVAAAWALVHAFLPSRIVLGGGLVEAQEDFFVAPIRRAVAQARLGEDAVTVVPARLGNLAGLIGAAHLAFRQAAANGATSRPPSPSLPHP